MWDTLVNTGLIKPSDFVRLSSTEAARVFNLYPQKGTIAARSDADIAIIDPNKEHVLSARMHHSALDTSVYEGMRIRGKVRFGLPIQCGKVTAKQADTECCLHCNFLGCLCCQSDVCAS